MAGIVVMADHMNFACLHLPDILTSEILFAVVGVAADLD